MATLSGRRTAPAAARPRVLLAVLSLGALSYALMSSLIMPAVPTIQAETGASETAVSWLISGYLLSATVATPICGRLGDMFGKRRVLLGLLAVLVAGTALAVVSTGIAPLIAARVLQGVAGGIYPLSFAIIRDEMPAALVPGAIGIISSLMGVGATVGVVVSGLVLARWSYHWLFLVILVGTVLALVAAWRLVPASVPPAGGRVNWRNATLMSAGFTLVLLGITSAPGAGWLGARTVALFAAGAGLTAAWMLAEVRSREPFLDMAMLRARPVWTANAVALLLGVLMFAGFLLVPQVVQEPRSTGYGLGLSVTAASLFLVPWSVVQVAFAAAAGPGERRAGAKTVLVVSIASCCAGGLMFTVARSEAWQILLASGLMGGGIGSAFASMSSLLVAHVRPDQTGAATGMNTVIRLFGGALGAQLAGSLLAAGTMASGSPSDEAYTAAFGLTLAASAGALVAAACVPLAPRLEERTALPGT